MKILAIESSGLTASAALLDGDTIAAEYSVRFGKTHSQTLLPMIDEICQMLQLDKQSIDVIAVTAGPGSFTGLRIGSATAKGIALGLHKSIAQIPTLEAMAYNGWGFEGIVCPMLDARNQQVFTGMYCFDREQACMKTLEEQEALPVEEIIGRLNAAGKSVLLMGDGANVYKETLREGLSVPCLFAPAFMNSQNAGTVAWLGRKYAEEGRLISGDQHRPDYLRVSQAERERAERERKQADAV